MAPEPARAPEPTIEPAPERGGFIKRFFDNFGKMPPEKPPIIPKPYRIPFFLGLSLLALIGLVLVVWLVVIPGIQAQQHSSGSGSSPTTTQSK